MQQLKQLSKDQQALNDALKQLREKGGSSLDQRLQAQGTTSEEIVRVEHQRQAAMNVTVRNVILSMSLISALDWAEFFESVSLVDAALHAKQDEIMQI